MNPLGRQDDFYSAFIQDEISFLEDLVHLTIGSQFEHNDYSGTEIQPSARLMWTVNQKNKIWGAVSKAVRTQSRAETDAIVAYLARPVTVPFPPFTLP
jgi:iron complex outermembrane receptor protein